MIFSQAVMWKKNHVSDTKRWHYVVYPREEALMRLYRFSRRVDNIYASWSNFSSHGKPSEFTVSPWAGPVVKTCFFCISSLSRTHIKSGANYHLSPLGDTMTMTEYDHMALSVWSEASGTMHARVREGSVFMAKCPNLLPRHRRVLWWRLKSSAI